MTGSNLGVLLLQLGTPDAPTPAALRRYLAQFLSDPRVIDLPRWKWLPILHGIVLRTRPRKSALEYRKVWTSEGGPLLVTSRQQAALLESRLTESGTNSLVRVAMRYGEPSTESALRELEAAKVDRIVALPMYPQYASATTGSSVEALYVAAGRRRYVPPISVVPPYYVSSGYIAALAELTRQSLHEWNPDHIVLSFHGIPERYVQDGDPYASHCFATAEALRQSMEWPVDRVTVAFQSRFGREVWLQPYTGVTLQRLGAARTGRLAVVCPGFTADCLETLEEIGAREKNSFLAAGGGELRLVPCLNVSSQWIDAMADLVRGLLGSAPILPGRPAPGERAPIPRRRPHDRLAHDQ